MAASLGRCITGYKYVSKPMGGLINGRVVGVGWSRTWGVHMR